MARKVTIPFAFGRADRVDPKFAPFGSLAVAKNLRVRADGRLASRTGYQPFTMLDQAGNTMVAYDLHEFSSGRLCAFGASQGEGHPVDVYEYLGTPSARPWRSSDETGAYLPTLTPFTYPRQVCGVPQPAQGIRSVDCAAGAGYVCAVYRSVTDNTFCYIQIVREADDQVIFARSTSDVGWSSARVCFSVDRFYFLGTDESGGDNRLQLGSFQPGTSSSISVIQANVSAGGFTAGNSTTEIEAVGNPANSIVVLAYALSSGSQSVLVKRYNASGTQQGSTLTLAAQTDVLNLAVEADEADNTVNLLVSQHSASVVTDVDLRTYNFSNSLLDGPTACNTGYRATLCRAPARSGWAEHVAVVSSDISSSGDIVVEWFDQDSHALTGSTTIGNAMLATAMVSAGDVGQPSAVAFGGFVGTTFGEDETNSLFYASLEMVHMAARDLRNSARNAEDFYEPLGLSLDSSTGRIAWCSVYFTGLDVENFTVTTVRLHGTDRRQTASAGGLLYIAGAPVQLYDGHSVGEAGGFNEVPGIKSITASTSGSLTNGATYVYVLVWEYALPDGTFYESPPSVPVEFETDSPGEDEALVTVFAPHSARVALGAATYGAQVTGVLYRTVWDAVNAARGSEFKEVQRFRIPSSLAGYGDDVVVNDDTSDAAARTRATLYTQGGPVEHNAPEMASYISASSGRITLAGLPRTSEFQESKEQELDEAVNFSGLSSFIGRTPNPINGVLSLDGTRILCTRTDLFAVAGDGPANDASGALPQPVEIPSPGGLRSWHSLLKGPDGVWLQLDDRKLYRTPRGLAAPEWLGVDVQNTLALFPEITGAARNRADDAVVFACSNAGGTDARIVARSLRTGVWTEDTPPLQASQGIKALCPFGDLTAYVSGGVVYRQHPTSFADGAGSVITTEWQTHPVYPFEVGGNGKIFDLQVTGEFRSSGTLALRLSYDDGVNMATDTYASFAITGLTVGASVKKRWSLQRDDVQSVVAELTFTPDTPGEGLIINAVTFLLDQSSGLEELDPADLA
jgi:hypothetical protein